MRCAQRWREYVFVYLPDWWWLVGCLGICVGRRAGADGGLCVAVSPAASLSSTSVSGHRDKGGQQDTHKHHIVVVELMPIEIRPLKHMIHFSPTPLHFTLLFPPFPTHPPPPPPLPILTSFFCPPARPGHSAIMGNNLLQKTCIFGRAKTCEMRP